MRVEHTTVTIAGAGRVVGWVWLVLRGAGSLACIVGAAGWLVGWFVGWVRSRLSQPERRFGFEGLQLGLLEFRRRWVVVLESGDFADALEMSAGGRGRIVGPGAGVQFFGLLQSLRGEIGAVKPGVAGVNVAVRGCPRS